VTEHRILVIGCGSIGERHLRCLQATGRAVVGICETNDTLRTTVTERYGVRESFADLDQALRSSWQSAVVATPAPSHIPLALRLVEAGIAPLIEKPLAVSDEGVATLCQRLQETSIAAGVAYVYRAHPGLAAMRQAITAGCLGRPLQVVVNAGQHFPTYRPAYRDTYYARHALGGGAVQDALTHVVNAVEWLVGPTTWVFADLAHLKLPGVEVEDTVHVLARQDQVMTCYSLNQHQAPNECTITVIGAKATARFELHRHRWSLIEEPETPWVHAETTFADRDAWFTVQEHAWLDVLEGKAAPLCSVAEAAHTLKVNQAILASGRTGQRIEIALETPA